MATVQTVINRSFRLLGVVAQGETPSASDTSDALVALNAMLDGWRNEKLMVDSFTNITVPLVNAQASYTIGATGADVTATSPVRIESAYVRKSGVDYDVEQIDDTTYQGIAEKTSQSDIPEFFLFNHTNANSTLYVYPVPNEVNNLYLRVWTPFAAFASASDTFSMRPGMEETVAFNLAVVLQPEYPAIQLNPIVLKKAIDSLASIKRINHKPFVSVTQLAGMFGMRSGNIIAGE